jgi:hypothetical protein
MATLDNIGGIGSLFGLSPESLGMAREQQYMDFASKVANAEASRPGTGTVLGANVMGARGVQQLGSLFGVQDPQEQLALVRQQAQQQFDTTTPQGLMQAAKFLNEKGDAAGARQAVMAVQNLQVQQANLQDKQLDIRRKESTIAKEELSATQEEKLRGELAALPPNATEQQVIEVVRKYGSPDKILQILTASQDRQAKIAVAASNKAAAPSKPLGTSLQKSEDKDLEAIDTYTAQSEALKPSIANLTPNSEGVRKLELGPAKNAKYIAQNALGNSTPESRAYEGLKSAVDTAVNLQVSAEKGVQTDKDVLRFANALIAAYGRNDTQATLEALNRYNDAIEKAKTRTTQRIDQRRISQKVEPLFAGQTPAQPSTKPSGEKKTRTLTSGLVVTIED